MTQAGTRRLQDQVLGMLIGAANAAAPCPTNWDMARVASSCASAVSYALTQLGKRGTVQVEWLAKRRRVTIRRTGRATDWSTGIAPHCGTVIPPAAYADAYDLALAASGQRFTDVALRRAGRVHFRTPHSTPVLQSSLAFAAR